MEWLNCDAKLDEEMTSKLTDPVLIPELMLLFIRFEDDDVDVESVLPFVEFCDCCCCCCWGCEPFKVCIEEEFDEFDDAEYELWDRDDDDEDAIWLWEWLLWEWRWLFLKLKLLLVRCLFVGGAMLSPPSMSLLSELDASMIVLLWKSAWCLLWVCENSILNVYFAIALKKTRLIENKTINYSNQNECSMFQFCIWLQFKVLLLLLLKFSLKIRN